MPDDSPDDAELTSLSPDYSLIFFPACTTAGRRRPR